MRTDAPAEAATRHGPDWHYHQEIDEVGSHGHEHEGVMPKHDHPGYGFLPYDTDYDTDVKISAGMLPPRELSPADLAHLTDLVAQQRAVAAATDWFAGRLSRLYQVGPSDRIDPETGAIVRGGAPVSDATGDGAAEGVG